MKKQILILNVLAFFFALATTATCGFLQIAGAMVALGLCAGALMFSSAHKVDENNNPVSSDL